MEFALSEEQQELAATVRALLDKRADARVETYDPALWSTLCEQIGVAASSCCSSESANSISPPTLPAAAPGGAPGCPRR